MPLKRKRRVPFSDKRISILAKNSAQKALNESIRVESTLKGVFGEARAEKSVQSLLNHQSTAQRVMLTKTISALIAQRLMRRATVPQKSRGKIFEAIKRLSDAEARNWTDTVKKRKENLLLLLEETLGERKAISFFEEYQKNFEYNRQKIEDALSQNKPL